MATLWKCRAVDAAAAQLVVRESGGLVAFTAMDDPLGAPAGPRAALARRRRPHRPRAGRAGHAARRLMVDWRLAERVAEAVAGGDGAGTPLAGGADLDAMAARAVRARHRVRAPAAGRAAARAGGRRAQGMGAREPRDDGRHARAAARAQLGSGPAAVARAACSSASRPAGSSASWAATCSASTSSRCSTPSARRGCCSSRPTCARPRAPSRPTRPSCWSGSSSTRSPTPCSSRGVPWLREHLAAMLRELLSSVKVEVDPAALLRLPKLRGPARGVGRGARGRPRARGRRARAQGRSSIASRRRWRSSRATPST